MWRFDWFLDLLEVTHRCVSCYWRRRHRVDGEVIECVLCQKCCG
jgi:hypothetical protein